LSRYFGPHNEEFRCHGINPDGTVHDCGLNAIDPVIVEILDDVREELGIPLVITSGTRCVIHNRDVGGAPDSAHLPSKEDGFSKAVDIKAISNVTRGRILEALWKWNIRRFEASNLHLHFDIHPNEKTHPTPFLMAVVFRGR